MTWPVPFVGIWTAACRLSLDGPGEHALDAPQQPVEDEGEERGGYGTGEKDVDLARLNALKD